MSISMPCTVCRRSLRTRAAGTSTAAAFSVRPATTARCLGGTAAAGCAVDELDHPAQHRGGQALPPIVLAALGPKMLQLSARYAGAHPYFTTPDHTAAGPLLVPEQAVSLDPAAAGGMRAYAARYLRMPNYTRMLRNYGFTDADIADGGSDHLVETVIPAGADAVGSAVRAHLRAGADHVVIQPLGASGQFDIAQLGELAGLVADLLER